MLWTEQHGYIGNIWVREHSLEKAGDEIGGHIHYFDHVSFLAKGRARVFLDNKEPRDFTAPTFVVIKKDHSHRVVALEDDTTWYCVFAVRDIDGDTTDIIHPENYPWFADPAPGDFWQKHNLEEKIKKTDIPDFII